MEVTRGERLYIGIFGNVNAGKSTLLNMLTGQEFSITSEIEGTTTDCVYKNMEVPEVGPVTFIDTAGFSDKTDLSKKRLEKTFDALQKCDIVIWLYKNDEEIPTLIKNSNKNLIKIKNLIEDEKINFYKKSEIKNDIPKFQHLECDVKNLENRELILKAIKLSLPEDFSEKPLTENLCEKGDEVLLVMPQDIQAPKGRLILPQVKIIRELLDKKCLVHCCTKENMISLLESLKNEPKLIITDSQIFKFVNDNKPKSSKLTSFSILMARNKGNFDLFLEDTKKIDSLNSNSRVLIAEACTHSPKEEDIGRIQIPRLLETKFPGIKIDFVRGTDFPFEKLSEYDLVIHCGSCMFNRSYVLFRQEECKKQNVPMTNYGLFLAKMNGITL